MPMARWSWDQIPFQAGVCKKQTWAPRMTQPKICTSKFLGSKGRCVILSADWSKNMGLTSFTQYASLRE